MFFVDDQVELEETKHETHVANNFDSALTVFITLKQSHDETHQGNNEVLKSLDCDFTAYYTVSTIDKPYIAYYDTEKQKFFG